MVSTTTQTVTACPPTPPQEPTTDTRKMSATSVSAANDLTSPASGTKHIWVITGPAGCGKTSVAECLQNEFSLPYLEGDTYHPPSNVEKMASGQPLTDADRWDWLIILREQALSTLAADPTTNGVIVTCSALKRKYRDVMRVAAYHHTNVQVHFVFLSATEELLLERVRARKGHYMKDSMVRSQFASLERPQEDEGDVMSVDASGTSKEVEESAIGLVRAVLEV